MSLGFAARQIQKVTSYTTGEIFQKLNLMQILSDTVRATAEREPVKIILIPAETETQSCLLPHSTI